MKQQKHMRNGGKIILTITLLVAFITSARVGLSQEIKFASGSVYNAPTVNARADLLIYQSNENQYKAWQLVERLKEGNQWSEARPIEAINSYGTKPTAENGYQSDFIGTPCLNQSGDTLYFTATYPGGAGGKDLYYAVRGESGWGIPVNLGKAINTGASEENPSISADGKTLYFTRILANEGDDKCYKIFSSVKTDHKGWSKPEPLPKIINSGCEKAPRILPDNVTLVFSSKRNEKPDFDIYASVKDITGKWSAPLEVKELNSKHDDGYVSVDFGNKKVFRSVAVSSDQSSVQEYAGIPSLLNLQRFYTLNCMLIDSVNNGFVHGDLKLLVQNELVEQWQHETGIAKILYGHKTFRLLVAAPGYDRKSITIQLPEEGELKPVVVRLSKQKENTSSPLAGNTRVGRTRKSLGDASTINEASEPKERDLAQPEGDQKDSPHDAIAITSNEKTTRGATAVAKTNTGSESIPVRVYFRFASSGIEDSVAHRLVVLSSYLKTNTQVKVEVTGFTDDIGERGYNQLLSERRAMAVKAFLTNQGVAENRIITKGLGEMKPFVPNISERSRSQNRRAEFKLQ